MCSGTCETGVQPPEFVADIWYLSLLSFIGAAIELTRQAIGMPRHLANMSPRRALQQAAFSGQPCRVPATLHGHAGSLPSQELSSPLFIHGILIVSMPVPSLRKTIQPGLRVGVFSRVCQLNGHSPSPLTAPPRRNARRCGYANHQPQLTRASSPSPSAQQASNKYRLFGLLPHSSLGHLKVSTVLWLSRLDQP